VPLVLITLDWTVSTRRFKNLVSSGGAFCAFTWWGAAKSSMIGAAISHRDLVRLVFFTHPICPPPACARPYSHPGGCPLVASRRFPGFGLISRRIGLSTDNACHVHSGFSASTAVLYRGLFPESRWPLARTDLPALPNECPRPVGRRPPVNQRPTLSL